MKKLLYLFTMFMYSLSFFALVDLMYSFFNDLKQSYILGLNVNLGIAILILINMTINLIGLSYKKEL